MKETFEMADELKVVDGDCPRLTTFGLRSRPCGGQKYGEWN